MLPNSNDIVNTVHKFLLTSNFFSENTWEEYSKLSEISKYSFSDALRIYNRYVDEQLNCNHIRSCSG